MMPIIYPKNCQGTTAGALRQIRDTGFSDACGGLYSLQAVANMVGLTDQYFSKNEPAGIFMSELAKKEDEINAYTDAILKSSKLMVESATDANKRMNDISGKTRDGAEKLGIAIDKFMKIATRPDFEKKVTTMEQFVSAMERLSAIEESGKLANIFKSLQGDL